MVFPDLVFIDTSIFIEENFFAKDNRINSLMKLAKDGRIRIVMPEITRQEVIKHLKSGIREAWKAFNRDCSILRNHPDVDNWRKTTNEKTETERALALFDAFLATAKVKVLNYTYCSDIDKVFNEYFDRQKPFGEGMKKDEFPDAFVLASLEKYSKESHQKIVMLSNDGDMTEYKSACLEQIDYREYVSKKITEGVALDELNKKLQCEQYSLIQEIEKKAVEYLDDFRLYLTRLNLMEVSSHSTPEVKVNLNVNNFEIVAVDKQYIEFELEPEIAFKVDVDYVNYDFAFYDREDGVWYNTENEVYEVDAEATVKTTMRYYYATQYGVDYLEIEDMDTDALMDAIE